MLPKALRLSAAEVRAVLKEGKPLRAPTVSAKYVAGRDPKAAIVVSKKVAKAATERNRLRRAGYAALPSPLPAAWMVFFINQPDFEPEDFTKLCSPLS